MTTAEFIEFHNQKVDEINAAIAELSAQVDRLLSYRDAFEDMNEEEGEL